MKCPKCSGNNIDTIENDIEGEINYGCLDCDCWFTIHSEPYTRLSEELKYEMTKF
jgi:transposase-like protein